MTFEVLQLGPYGTLIVVVIFIIFVIFVKKALGILFNSFLIAAISAVFPVFMNSFAGYSFPLTAGTFVFFVSLGLGLYALYLIAKFVHGLLAALEKRSNSNLEDRVKKLEKKKPWERKNNEHA